jgi:hypothetical protein
MRIVFLDESRERLNQFSDLLKRSRNDIDYIRGSSEFIARIEKSSPDRALIDADAWKHGRAMYNYLGVGRKLENTPITVYNAPEGFTGLTDRPKHNADVILPKSASLESIVDSIG